MDTIGEHGQDEEPVDDCDCRRCAIAARDRLRRNIGIHVQIANDACDAARLWFATNSELHALLAECEPHVLASVGAEHLLDGFRPQRRPLDDLADRVRAALGMFVIDNGDPEENDMRYCCYCGRPLKTPNVKVTGAPATDD